MEGILVLLCGGERYADRVNDPWLEMLRVIVRRSRGSVLVQTDCLAPHLPGRVLVVQPRRADDPVGPVTAHAVWLGPLDGDAQLEAVRGWLGAGGPGGEPLPAALRSLRLVPVPLPAASLN